MTAPRVAVVVLLLLAMQWADAASFRRGLEAYDRADYATALREWRPLAERGEASAQYHLGVMYDDGEGVLEDDRQATHWYRQAAEQGHVAAQLDLALMYATGRGVSADYAQAVHWYRKVAERGYASAQYQLGVLYEDGKGVPEDHAQAARWYREAARQGYAAAQRNLGRLYAIGRGVPEDSVRAYAWYGLAAAQGDAQAATARARIRRRMALARIAEAEELGRELRGGRPAAGGTARRTEPDAPVPEMVHIPGGCIRMGSPDSEAGRAEDERRHQVCLEDFSMGKYEVTRGEYAAFVRETGRAGTNTCRTYGQGGWEVRANRSWRAPGYAQADTHPVVCVSFDDAIAYARWLSDRTGRRYRLPTEAEWEYAARNGTDTARSWGNDPADACVYANAGDRTLKEHYNDWRWTIHECRDGHVHTAPVGSYRANGYGLHDMLGNVWEWTCSTYDRAYEGSEKRCTTGREHGVVRGGSWSNSPRWARSAGRFGNAPHTRLDLAGFRLVRD